MQRQRSRRGRKGIRNTYLAEKHIRNVCSKIVMTKSRILMWCCFPIVRYYVAIRNDCHSQGKSMLLIPRPKRLSKEDYHEFKVRLGHSVGPCSKNSETNTYKNKNNELTFMNLLD